MQTGVTAASTPHSATTNEMLMNNNVMGVVIMLCLAVVCLLDVIFKCSFYAFYT